MKRHASVERFVCTVCGADDVLPLNRFTEAIEYRRLDSKERLHRRTTRLICRECVLVIKHDGVKSPEMFSFDE